MPRKMKPGKVRRPEGFPLAELSINDILAIHVGGPAAPERQLSCDRIRTLEDLRLAWEQNRESFLQRRGPLFMIGMIFTKHNQANARGAGGVLIRGLSLKKFPRAGTHTGN